MKRPRFAENGIYHVYNQGIENKVLFKTEQDYLRFIHDLFEFNDTHHSSNFSYRFRKDPTRVMGINAPYFVRELRHTNEPRELLVDILGFVLMPNHFHLLLREKKRGGITKFMHRLGTGYALHFNQSHKHEGSIFHRRFASVRLEGGESLHHLLCYIHADPLTLNAAPSDPVSFLNSYRWSSHLDYCGWNNFPSVTQRDLILDFFGGEEQYKKSISEWVQEKEKHTGKIRDVLLEKVIALFLFVMVELEWAFDLILS